MTSIFPRRSTKPLRNRSASPRPAGPAFAWLLTDAHELADSRDLPEIIWTLHSDGSLSGRPRATAADAAEQSALLWAAILGLTEIPPGYSGREFTGTLAGVPASLQVPECGECTELPYQQQVDALAETICTAPNQPARDQALERLSDVTRHNTAMAWLLGEIQQLTQERDSCPGCNPGVATLCPAHAIREIPKQ